MSDIVRLQWRLTSLMRRQGLRSATDLQLALRAKGVSLSLSQTWRLTQATPEKLRVDLLEALLSVLQCSPQELLGWPAVDPWALPPQHNPSKMAVLPARSLIEVYGGERDHEPRKNSPLWRLRQSDDHD